MNKSMEMGQVSTEYVVITAFLLVIIGILFAYALLTLGESTKISTANNTVNKLANAANQVSAFGQGNTVYIDIEVPSGIYSGSASGHQIKYVVTVISGRTDVWKNIRNPISPVTLPTSPGRYAMKVEMADENVVISQV